MLNQVMQDPFEEGDLDDEDDEVPQQKPKKKSADEEAVMVCGICRKMYKSKSMCPNCDVVLKGKGE
jgi:uncharacterized CHY-type Zn-finger protein